MEFLVEAPAESAEEWAKILEESMVKAGKIYCPDIPLKAVSEIGDYWIH